MIISLQHCKSTHLMMAEDSLMVTKTFGLLPSTLEEFKILKYLKQLFPASVLLLDVVCHDGCDVLRLCLVGVVDGGEGDEAVDGDEEPPHGVAVEGKIERQDQQL